MSRATEPAAGTVSMKYRNMSFVEAIKTAMSLNAAASQGGSPGFVVCGLESGANMYGDDASLDNLQRQFDELAREFQQFIAKQLVFSSQLSRLEARLVGLNIMLDERGNRPTGL